MPFLWPNLLWLLLLVPALAVVYILAQRRRQKYALRYASLSLVKEALGRGPGKRRHIPAILFLVALTVMVVGLARPAATIMLPSQQGTVVLAIDVSGSMRADDLKPNRLEAAKVAALAFVEKQPKNVRIGVVSFSDSASVVQSPTTDREAIKAAINRLVNQRRTAVGSAIITSLDSIFEEPGAKPAPSQPDWLVPAKPAPTPPPVPRGNYAPAIIVLLTDGASNTGPRPLEAAAQAADKGVRVFTVGVGSPQGAVLRTEGFAMRVRLDEDTLKQIAERTGGSYFKAESETDLSQIYENLSTHLVFQIEKSELTVWFTGFAALVLLVAGALSLLWFNRLP
ncbi:MAG: VWA domain-containing protein [Dehalococcoidales bacterium]|nr:VWA domain-containing protein [Dehalococcoidales bacterium]